MSRTIVFTLTLQDDQAAHIDARFKRAVENSGQSLESCLCDMLCRWVSMMEAGKELATMTPGSSAVVIGLSQEHVTRLKSVAGENIKAAVEEAVHRWIESHTGPPIVEGGGWLN